MQLSEATLELYAAKYYNNPNCIDKEEFIEDFNRLKYIKRLVKRYKATGDLKERLILNHLTILYNTFESTACIHMLWFKLKENFHVIKPFLILLNRLPDTLKLDNKRIIHFSDINLDIEVVDKIRRNILCQTL